MISNSSIGAGGMGEMYRARDSKLDRDIAIKVLPPELACQPERVKRVWSENRADHHYSCTRPATFGTRSRARRKSVV